MIPYGSVNMQRRPFFTATSFLFHLCLLITPIFALGHVMLWDQSWGISWWTLPDSITNLMTFVVVITGMIFILRRIAYPQVRYVTSWKEYLLVILAVAPYATGLMAYYHTFDYDTVIVVHMWTGALWLIAIPFTWLSHMFYFPFTRSYMGSEFGYVRNAKDW
jgi:nitrate reductase gamma subunit